jgi:hypothetical protein
LLQFILRYRLRRLHGCIYGYTTPVGVTMEDSEKYSDEFSCRVE